MQEPECIKAFKNGEEDAFKNIFKLFHARLCFFARGLVLEETEAEDIIQDAFLKLWERRTNFEDFHSIKAFLYLTIKNACRNLYKHQQVIDKYNNAVLPSLLEENTILSRIIEAEVVEEVFGALQQLPNGSRQVLHLSYFQGLSNQEVADQLQISINTVKTQKVRALHLLRGIMIKESPLALLLLVNKFI
jgi:RNA polymerase sigma-70 factor (family 1)